jgi:hypothetical protein
LSGAFFLLSLMKTARGLGLPRGFGDFLRGLFKQRGWYEDRRSLQVAASIAVALVVMTLVVWGLLWTWHRIKRYRLAVGWLPAPFQSHAPLRSIMRGLETLPRPTGKPENRNELLAGRQ